MAAVQPIQAREYRRSELPGIAHRPRGWSGGAQPVTLARPQTYSLLWLLVAISGSAHLATGIFHDVPVQLLQISDALQLGIVMLPLGLFVLVHGSAAYGWRGILAYSVICLVVTNIIENVNILTGFPGGHFHYTESLGPKLFQVPLLIGAAYVAVGYLAWMLARLILQDVRRPQTSVFAVPLLASLLMVAWDLSFDPFASTVRQAWIWRDGGSYFGVPATNFFSWCLTTYLFFQLFAIYLRYAGNRERDSRASWQFWSQPVVLYGTIAATVMVSVATTGATGMVTDQAGVVWRVDHIHAASALVCTFTMGTFTVLALMNLARMMRSRS